MIRTKIGVLMAMCLLLSSCSHYNKFQVRTLSSPDHKHCLSFIAEFDNNNNVIGNRIYMYGNYIEFIDSLPTDNYLLIPFISSEVGISVKWGDIIEINGMKCINHLSSPNIKFHDTINEHLRSEFEKKLWVTYDFYDLIKGKYPSCSRGY